MDEEKKPISNMKPAGDKVPGWLYIGKKMSGKVSMWAILGAVLFLIGLIALIVGLRLSGVIPGEGYQSSSSLFRI